MLFGFPGVLPALPGIEANSEEDQIIIEKMLNGEPPPQCYLNLTIDITGVPEPSNVYQKKFPITFDYYNNHACGW